MRFPHKQKPKYKPGDTRIIKIFALFPTRVDDYIIWLEYYLSHQRYTIYYIHDDTGIYPSYDFKEYSRTLLDA